MNEMIIPTGQATLVDIRTDSKTFPRLHTYDRQEAIGQMNIILLMAFQYRGQQADAYTINQMSASLIELLIEDEYSLGMKYLTFEEIKRIVRKAALGQGKEMYGISVSSIFQALADYCKGEGKMASQQARVILEQKRELARAIVAPMLDSYANTLIKK
jgi:hypothetical protein